ncbi:DUF4174 domain-containing protein [uncultured Polaribacter sp.]|uniref:DUF4174 domain-containing protein n=1 Tax=uncultured Polaribacter sp. TaxID=174711 RepID=UPI0026238FD3|nr:DUF4174 domain-containing protein [uncultured Polaribacter sp.]
MKLTTLLLFFSLISFGQNLTKHKWQKRVLLVFTEDKNDTDFRNYVLEIDKKQHQFLERKLILYKFNTTSYGVNFEREWINSSNLYSTFILEKTKFKTILIGLDGAVKQTANKLIPLDNIFTSIDGMPMRKRELEKNKK